MQADLVLFNGHVYTMDATCPRAQAVAISGDRILAVGNDAALRPLLHSGGQAVDLGGRVAIPGLIDAHAHFGWYSIALYQNQVNLDNVPTKAEAVARVAKVARQIPAAHWIQGKGWNKNIWPDVASLERDCPTNRGFPTAADLDALVPDHPVLLRDKSLHAAWLNSRALALAGITAATQAPAGGEILHDESGQPTGILLETAIELVTKAVPKPDVGMFVNALRQGMAQAHRLGLTGFHDPGHPAILAALQVLRAQRELGLRALIHISTDELEAAIELGFRSGLGDEYLRIGGVKIFADGALGPQSAHLLAPYQAPSGSSTNNLGMSIYTPDELCALVHRAHQAGISVSIHAIGDAANRAVLDAIECTQHLTPNAQSPIPNRIEHVQLLHPDDLPRLAQLGVVASMQPIHATSDMEIAERYWGRRCDLSYAWRSVLDSGAHLAFGSDCPVETLNPLAGIHAAVTRRRADGSPGPEGWIPAQRLTVTEAVHAYTLGAAYASGEVHRKGSLLPGKLADLVVLSKDIFSCDPMAIVDARVEMTIFDGQIVYENEIGQGRRHPAQRENI